MWKTRSNLRMHAVQCLRVAVYVASSVASNVTLVCQRRYSAERVRTHPSQLATDEPVEQQQLSCALERSCGLAAAFFQRI